MDSSSRPYLFTSASSGGTRGGARPLLFLGQNEARRAEKSFYGGQAPRLSQGLDDRPHPPPLSEGLDPPLAR